MKTASLDTRNKAAARLKLSELLRDEESGDRFRKHSRQPLTEHLADYRKYLTGRDNTERYVRETSGRIQAIITGCKFRSIKDLSASDVSGWLADRRKAEQFGTATSNHHLRAIKSFTGWLVKDRRTGHDPLQHMSGLNTRADVRRQRRHLSGDDFGRLIGAAEDGKVVCGLTGHQRAMLYRTAAMTGLRASELASLTPGSFDLTSEPPVVTVAAAYSKRRREDVLPLHLDLCRQLREWLQDRRTAEQDGDIIRLAAEPSDGPLWPGRWAERRQGAAILRVDLKTAGIPYRDAAGRVFDFHALRHQFISTLAEAAVHPKTTQELARHSDINLTMSVYSHVGLKDLSSAVDRLPAIQPTRNPQKSAGNGAG